MDLNEQDALIARLQQAVEEAKDAYVLARVEHDRGIERMRDLGATHPDGSIFQATRAFNYTLERYRKALWRYNRYILDGKLPEEETAAGKTA